MGARAKEESPATITPIRVRYAETDRMGNVNSAHYLTWFELGRSDFLRERGVPYAEFERRGLALPVVEAQVRYHRPVGYDELVSLETRLESTGPSRVIFAFRLLRDGELVADGRTVQACCGSDGKLIRIPDDLLKIAGPRRG